MLIKITERVWVAANSITAVKVLPVPAGKVLGEWLPRVMVFHGGMAETLEFREEWGAVHFAESIVNQVHLSEITNESQKPNPTT